MMLHYERQASRKGFQFIIGIDEAGRGPLAGPVVAAAALLKKHTFKNKICDSKKLNPQERESAFLEIFENATVGIGIINESVIDSVNILQATFYAMTVAVNQLIAKLPPSELSQENYSRQVHLLVDGNRFKTDLPYSYQTIVDGDHLSTSISCASIVAKVTRDRILKVYDQVFPQYGFKQHKGYPTPGHRAAIKKYGLSLVHRKTFRVSDGLDEE